jgi:Asp-tRNA(Asn)/Glu-tRNA(Gln) amidotransferase A subunit family amidase
VPPPRPSPDWELNQDITGWRIAYSPDLGYAEVDPEVARVARAAAEAFQELGAHVTEATPQWGNPVEAMWNGIWVPGIGSGYDLVDWEAQRGRVDDNLIELMHEAERLTGVDVGRADVFRGAMWDTFTEFMTGYDLLLCPTPRSRSAGHSGSKRWAGRLRSRSTC